MCVPALVYGVKRAIHEQLADIKSGEIWASVYDCCLCLCIYECGYAHICVIQTHLHVCTVCQFAALPYSDVVTISI